ncbi:glycogen/starch/alpha-glucan phosphorylase [Candidatus Poribacteria bacterium]|nr:glycogen/starch/alpha-glucan phosphorylase [Candidatus Poribacteria bacterium]
MMIKKDECASTIRENINNCIMLVLGNDYTRPKKDTFYNGLAYCVRDKLVKQWLKAQNSYYEHKTKRVYYLSLEFLPGRFLMNYILNMRMKEQYTAALEGLNFTLEDLETEEYDAGLGNGGLGRLASCFMDSMATLKIPGYGYGIRYDYGIFYQSIVNGYQVEQSDNWVRYGNPWEFLRRGFLYKINFYGRSESYTDNDGKLKFRWVNASNVMAMACDIFIPGYDNDNVTNMRLWTALTSQDFNFEEFNKGDYIGAMEAKVLNENISKVLYPSDTIVQGKELRFKQQYFFVAATFQDILRRYKKDHKDFKDFPNKVAVQLNDTHPTIAIPELMRILMDEEGLGWDESWDICINTFSYTNHTILPEALETWAVSIISKILPRHMEIIYEINARFLKEVEKKYPNNNYILSKLSIIQEYPQKSVRMAHLAIVGSHTVNGVAELHTKILKNNVFKEFNEIYPARIINITNGITQRRWLLQANQRLSNHINSTIGEKWITDLYELKKLLSYVDNKVFRTKWSKIKKENKIRLAEYIKRRANVEVNVDSLFDVHVKRIHEYKRQLLNVLHTITLYNRIKSNPNNNIVPRTKIFAGKAAPAYFIAKLIIKLINSVAEVINKDNSVNNKLKVVFLPNYCISQAEKIIPAADLSEQISTVGMEASGTSNMKFALNGALTIGTLDGANIEIMEEVGKENMFIFGLKIEDVNKLRNERYNPYDYYNNDFELKSAIDMISSGYFSSGNTMLFEPLIKSLLNYGDYFLVLADYRNYISTQDEVDKLYLNQEEWIKRSIINTANMGKFSSDRAIREYAEKVWKATLIKF